MNKFDITGVVDRLEQKQSKKGTTWLSIRLKSDRDTYDIGVFDTPVRLAIQKAVKVGDTLSCEGPLTGYLGDRGYINYSMRVEAWDYTKNPERVAESISDDVLYE